MRRWGIADRLRAALWGRHPSNVLFVTRLAGRELARFDNAMYCAPGRNPLYSEHAQWIPQYTVEEVMREHAQSLPGVQIRFNAELRGLEQDAEGARVQLHDKAAGPLRFRRNTSRPTARAAPRELIGARIEGQYGSRTTTSCPGPWAGRGASARPGRHVLVISSETPTRWGP
jgi:hypothetical protein